MPQHIQPCITITAGITVSMEQLVEALARVKEAGLQDRISLIFCDYREVVNRFGADYFDAVVSCEMIEAVGHEHLPTYFDVIGQAVKPGGLFAMQVQHAVLSRSILYFSADGWHGGLKFPEFR